MSRQLTTLGTAYADDVSQPCRLSPGADTVRSFRQDADLEVCLAKCTIYMPGIQIERAQNLIRECIHVWQTRDTPPHACTEPRRNPSQRPLRRWYPGGSVRLRPRIRSKQVWHNLQGHRPDARLRRSAYQVPAPQALHEHAFVIPVAKCHSRQYGNRQQTVMTVHTLALPTSTTRLYRRCSVPPQATPSCMRLSSCRSDANSKSNPRTTREGTR